MVEIGINRATTDCSNDSLRRPVWTDERRQWVEYGQIVADSNRRLAASSGYSHPSINGSVESTAPSFDLA